MPLVIVPTPVGNLGDITLRGLQALREADVIACEDTRRTLKLLNSYDIRKPLISYHRHNERGRSGELLDRLLHGETVALVSDAGTPGISDPGSILIAEAVAANVEIDVLPGANALLPALLLSGLSTQPFTFVGFLEGRETERREHLLDLADSPATLIFYISPHGLAKELDFLALHLGDRRAALVREISKIHQEILRGTLDGLANLAREREIRGEIALIVAGRDKIRQASDPTFDWRELARTMRREGLYDKEIAKMLFARYGIARNEIKAFLLQEVTANDNGE